MAITEQEIKAVKEIILNGARTHFPPPVQFHDANLAVRLDAEDQEYIRVELLYSAPNPVLDGYLMMTLFRVIDEPIRNAGITANTLVGYSDINDPTLPAHMKATIPPAPAS
jgi:hypothetical protein